MFRLNGLGLGVFIHMRNVSRAHISWRQRQLKTSVNLGSEPRRVSWKHQCSLELAGLFSSVVLLLQC